MASTLSTIVFRTNDPDSRYPSNDPDGQFVRVGVVYPNTGQQYAVTLTLDEAYDVANNIQAVLMGIRR